MSNHSAFLSPFRGALLAGVFIGLASAPAFADAVTYTGTIGAAPIVLELTELKDGPLLGRYSYQSNGANIPLHPRSASQSDVVLAEEAPCTPALCVRADDNLVLDAPLAGQFDLHYSPDTMKLTGTWRESSSAGAELPVDLNRVGQRSYHRDDAFPYGSFLWVNYDNAPITPENSPYDYAKMQVALTEGPMLTFGGASYREVTDPRTKFAAPRIVSLPGGGDTAPVNAGLDQRRWATNLAGFECLSGDYLSGVWMPLPFGTGGKSLGGVDHYLISIDYLSDTVMTLRQSGRLSCGGGDPYDHIGFHTYDVRTGRALDLSRIFKDWDAASDAPAQPLADWVAAAYRSTPSYDAEHAAACLDADSLTDGLEVSFAENDVAVFLIGSSEDGGCVGPILALPLAGLTELLTETAADYFPSLAP